MTEAQRWAEFGRYLVEQRERLGLGRREAARRSKVPEAAWRELETGYKNTYRGVRLLPNPKPDRLRRIAETLELPPDDLVTRVASLPRRTHQAQTKAVEDRLPRKIASLGDRDRRLVERLVDKMLEEE